MKNYIIALLMIAILLWILPVSAMARDVTAVNRTVSDGPDSSGAYEVSVQITANLPTVVGIREVLPSGYSFVSATLPADQYNVSGNAVMFSAINVTSFKYYVKGPASGRTGITGQWTDMLSQHQGEVTYAGQSSGSTTGNPTASSADSSATPGFEAFIVLLSIVTCMVAISRGRRQ